MRLELSAEREAAGERLRALLAAECPPERARSLERSAPGYSAELWMRLAQQGWLAPGPLLDLVIRFEALGRAGTPGPFLAHFESLLALDELGAQPPVAPEPIALACMRAAGAAERRGLEVLFERRSEYWSLSGRALFVPWAEAARELLVVARHAGAPEPALFRVALARSGIECILLPNLGPERLFEIRLRDVRVPAEKLVARDCAGPLSRARSRATLLVCAEQVGAAQAALELALGHARNREQFGRPIGSFQAVSHHCANMALATDAAHLAVLDAAGRIDAGEAPALQAAHAKVVCADAARRVTATAHQVMGGVGFLEDADLARHTRRVKALESRLGTPDWHREWLADALDL